MPISVFLFLFVELLAVSYIDWRYKKISNFWSILNILLYFAVLQVFPGVYVLSWQSLMVSMSFLFVGFILFRLKIMGAGDSKFLFSLYLLIPESLQEDCFLYLAYSTILIGVSLLIYNTYRNIDLLDNAVKTKNISIIKKVYGSRFSYAPVVLLSWVLLAGFKWEKLY